MKQLLHIPVSEGFYNCRIKFYPDSENNWFPVEKMTSEYAIFNPDGLEKEGWKKYEREPRQSKSLEASDRAEPDTENIDRACRRARARMYDIIRCNSDFRYFCTLTFNAEIVDRTNYTEVVRKFSQWCDNRVRRQGLKYVSVIEYHHDKKGMHFHVISNEALKLVDSGTVKVPGHKRPVKTSTADRYGIAVVDRKTVYNISDWHYGFSTAIQITDDPGRVKISAYLQKYLTKDSERVGGRWYYSGGELLRPRYEYVHDDFYSAEDTYMFNVPGNTIKVLLLPQENGSHEF